jgi:hypothetical protein
MAYYIAKNNKLFSNFESLSYAKLGAVHEEYSNKKMMQVFCFTFQM